MWHQMKTLADPVTLETEDHSEDVVHEDEEKTEPGSSRRTSPPGEELGEVVPGSGPSWRSGPPCSGCLSSVRTTTQMRKGIQVKRK